MGGTEIPGGECHRHGIRDKEKTIWFGCSDSNWGFWQQCQWMHRQIMAFHLHMHSGFPTERLEQMIMTSLNDVTVISHTIWGGKYIRKSELKPGVLSGFLALNSWVY